MEGAAAPLRVIFLDIDGVICCNSMGRLEDKKLRILQGVAQTAQAKIVLSTDWRRVPQLKTQLIGALRGLAAAASGGAYIDKLRNIGISAHIDCTLSVGRGV